MNEKVHIKQTSLAKHTMCGRKTEKLQCVEWEDRTWAPTCITCLREFFAQVPNFDMKDFQTIVNKVFNE